MPSSTTGICCCILQRYCANHTCNVLFPSREDVPLSLWHLVRLVNSGLGGGGEGEGARHND